MLPSFLSARGGHPFHLHQCLYRKCILPLRRLTADNMQKVQAGAYEEAFEMLRAIDTQDHRTLKMNQYVTSFMALLKARRAIRRYVGHGP